MDKTKKKNPYKRKLTFPKKTITTQKRKYVKKQPANTYPYKSLQCGYAWGPDFTFIGYPWVYQIVFPRAHVDPTNQCITNISRTSDTIFVSGFKVNMTFRQQTHRKLHVHIAILECKNQETTYNNYHTDFFQNHFSENTNTVDFTLTPTSYDSMINTLPINSEKYTILHRKKFILDSEITQVTNNAGTVVSYLNRDAGTTNYKVNDVWIPLKKNVDFFNGAAYYPRRNFLLVLWAQATNVNDWLVMDAGATPLHLDIKSTVYYKNI